MFFHKRLSNFLRHQSSSILKKEISMKSVFLKVDNAKFTLFLVNCLKFP